MRARRRRFLPVIGLLLLAAGAGALALEEGPVRWIEVKSPHFTLLTDAGATKGQQVVRELETLRLVLSRITTGIEVDSSVPTIAYLFKDMESFRRYRGATLFDPAVTTIGLYTRGLHANLLAGLASAGERGVWYHEYLHDVIGRNFETAPLWFNEGMAEFYSTFAIDGTEIAIGRPIGEHVRYLRKRGMLPLRDLLRVTHRSPEYNEADKQGVFYAQSWALVHYLLRGEEERRPQIARFFTLMGEGKPIDEAFAGAFQADYASLEKELKAYIDRDNFPFVRVALGELGIPPVGEVRELSRVEERFHLGDLLLALGDISTYLAEEHFREVLKADPAHADAIAGLGTVFMEEGKLDEAIALFERAAALRPSDAVLCHRQANALLEQAVGDWDVFEIPATLMPDVVRVRELLERCRGLDPRDPAILADLGLTFVLLRDPDPAPGIRALEMARRASPNRTDIPFHLLMLLVARGDRARAEAVVETHITRIGSARQVEQARELLTMLEFKEGYDLLRRGEYAAAVESLERAAARTQNQALKERIAADLARARELAGHDERIEGKREPE